MVQKQACFILNKACFLFIFLSLFYFSPSAKAAISPEIELKRLEVKDYAQRIKAWEDPYWLKLLHFEKNIFGKTRNRVSSPDFFLSKWGKISPKIELETTINGLIFEGAPDLSPECQFPERYNWLRKKLNISSRDFPPKVCKEFEDWKNIIYPEAVSLVFASGYLNNPSTAYGHTFFRLHRLGGKGADLLDYTLNYAADTGDDQGFLFALKGLIGAYPGRFSTIPYYIKIQQYRNMGNRDVWEFPLDLNKEETETLLRHSWELGKISFPYLFFTKNCAWELLPILEIIRPNLNLTKEFHSFVIPSDTAIIIGKNFKRQPKYRPSLWNTVLFKKGTLNEEEQETVYKLSSEKTQQNGFEKLKLFPDDRKAAVLELSGDYIYWKFFVKKIKKPDMNALSAPVLSARAKLGKQNTFPEYTQTPPSVLDAHDSFRFGAGLISYNKGLIYELSGRFAIQDLLDYDPGYLPDSTLEMGNFRFRYARHYNRFYVEQGQIAKVLSLNPWDKWVKKNSWEMAIGFEQAPETGRETGRSLIWDMTAGTGITAKLPFENDTLIYALAAADSGFGPSLDDNYRIGGGLKSGLFANCGDLRFNAEARYYSFILGDTGPLWAGTIAASYKLSLNTSVRAAYNWRKDKNEIGIYFHKFFFAL